MSLWNVELMAKKKKKSKKSKKRSASSMMALLDDAGATAEAVTVVATKPKTKAKPKAKAKPKTRGKATCGVCGKPDQVIVITDVDEKWEDRGHPDQFERDVCVACVSDYQSRDDCAVVVYDAMRKQLRTKEFAERDIDQAVRIAWRTFNVEFDHIALAKMAKKLKVKHPWLKGKKTK